MNKTFSQMFQLLEKFDIFHPQIDSAMQNIFIYHKNPFPPPKRNPKADNRVDSYLIYQGL